VYTADPRKVKGAFKLDEITYDEMLELATLGAQVLNNRSVEMAKKYNVALEVRSSITNAPGTIVKEVVKMEKMLIKSVAKDADVASVMIVGLPDEPGIAFKIFSRVANAHINVDIILQSVGRDGTKDITFTVPGDKGQAAVDALKEYCDSVGVKSLTFDESYAKVSIVGAGMETHEGVAAQMFEALADSKINLSMISTSEIKVSALIPKEDADRAVTAIHNRFFGE
jgi:aspartate kinase